MKRLISIFAIFASSLPVLSYSATQSSYPTKGIPVAWDKALITDSADGNKTKQATVGSLPISTATQTALDGKANASAFASQTAFTSAWGWTPGGISAWSDIQALLTPGGTYVKANGTTGDPTGTLPTGTDGQTVQYGSGGAPAAVDLAPLAFTDNVSRNSSTGVVSVPVTATATSGSAVPLTSGGAYTALGGKQDALVSGTNIKTVNNASLLGAGNITIAGGTGGGLTSTLSSAPYSDVACTGDGVYNHTLYKCIDNGSGTGYFTEYVATTAYLNATPVDTTPDAFSFTDVTNAALSTGYTALAQINGIAAGITCSGSGGTVAACTGSTAGTCGTFGATSGSITNGQYVGAKVTSSGTASTASNNVVTCGGVSDTFTATTAGGVYTDDFDRADETPLSGSGVWTNPGGSYYVLKVESNAVTSMSGNGIAYYATASHTFTANQYSQVKVTTNDNAFAGPVARFNPSTSYYYQAGIYYGDAKISRVRGDGNSASWAVASGQSIAGKVLKLEASGTSPVTLKVYIDGVQVGSDVVDSSAYAIQSGQPGIGTTGTGVIDNWQAGEL